MVGRKVPKPLEKCVGGGGMLPEPLKKGGGSGGLMPGMSRMVTGSKEDPLVDGEVVFAGLVLMGGVSKWICRGVEYLLRMRLVLLARAVAKWDAGADALGCILMGMGLPRLLSAALHPRSRCAHTDGEGRSGGCW